MIDASQVSTGGRDVFLELPQTTLSSRLAGDADVLHRRVRDLQEATASHRRSALLSDLEVRQQEVAARSGGELLAEISNAGLAWRDIARIVGVSVPAIQKWRRGEGMSGARRLSLAKIVALLGVLNDSMISDPSSWLEMPVKQGVTVSRLELLCSDRYDLVLLLVVDETAPAVEVDRVLDEFDPDWRRTRARDGFESYVASDGVVSIRMAPDA